MVRNIIIGVIILGMLGWALIQAVDPEADEQLTSIEDNEGRETLSGHLGLVEENFEEQNENIITQKFKEMN